MIKKIWYKITDFLGDGKRIGRKILFIILGIGSIAYAVGTTTILDTNVLNYPLFANTDIEKLEFAYSAQKDMEENEHDVQGTRYRNGEITEYEWFSWKYDVFRPKYKKVLGEVWRLRDNLGYTVYVEDNATETERIATEKKNFKKSKKYNITTDNILNPNMVGAVFEDWSGYVESDASNRISTTTTRVTFDGIARNEDAWLSKDFNPVFGVDTDFEIALDYEVTTDADGTSFFQLANVQDDADFIQTNSLSISIRLQANVTLLECLSNSCATDTGTWTAGVTDYFVWERDIDASVDGTMYLFIYTDSARTSLRDTLIVVLSTNRGASAFRYLHAINTFNNGEGGTQIGFVENVDLAPATATPPVIEPTGRGWYIQ